MINVLKTFGKSPILIAMMDASKSKANVEQESGMRKKLLVWLMVPLLFCVIGKLA